MRVTDEMIRHWLIWARNFEEIVAYHVGSGKARRFRVRLTPGVTCDGTPFRLREGILDITGHDDKDVVPHELMFTAREALAFGMGCAVGRTTALVGHDADHGWIHDRENDWTPREREAFAARRQEARVRNEADLERERTEHEAERQQRIAEYRRRKAQEEREELDAASDQAAGEIGQGGDVPRS